MVLGSEHAVHPLLTHAANREHFPFNFNLDIKGGYQCGTSLLVPFVVGRGLGGSQNQVSQLELLSAGLLIAVLL